MRPLTTKKDGGPVHGGDEEPGEPGSSPSTLKPDYLGLADLRPTDDLTPALLSLKRLVRGVY